MKLVFKVKDQKNSYPVDHLKETDLKLQNRWAYMLI